jgi:excisionase family DNA binding protein
MPTRRKPQPEVLPDLTRQQAADTLNVGLAKVDELVRDGVLQSYKLGESRRAGRRITRESVERLRRGRPVHVLQTENPSKWTPPEAA